MPKKTSSTGLHINSGLQAGNLNSDLCYLNRNMNSATCTLLGWPQNSGEYNSCVGNNNEIDLKTCLSASNEPNWWKNFDGCTGPKQCIDISGPHKNA